MARPDVTRTCVYMSGSLEYTSDLRVGSTQVFVLHVVMFKNIVHFNNNRYSTFDSECGQVSGKLMIRTMYF
jgi:hypothetical protein